MLGLMQLSAAGGVSTGTRVELLCMGAAVLNGPLAAGCAMAVIVRWGPWAGGAANLNVKRPAAPASKQQLRMCFGSHLLVSGCACPPTCAVVIHRLANVLAGHFAVHYLHGGSGRCKRH